MKTSLSGLFAAFLCHLNANAWEGHRWEDWHKITTWKKVYIKTDQADRREIVPLLGGPPTTNQIIPSLPEWEANKQRMADVIQRLLGNPNPLQVPSLEVHLFGTEDFPKYTRRHISIRSKEDDWIPAYLLVPKNLPTNPVPAMICLHQTVAQGKQEPCGILGDPELAFAVELVERGYVCLAPDVIGFGERIRKGKQPYDESLAFYSKHPQWSFMGKMIWDIGRMVDYLQTLPFVHPRKIGSIGHSHGAYGTLFAAAFEPRIAASIASCGFTSFRSDPNPERWSHATALIPQLGLYLPDAASIPFDWQHVLALIAPRPLFVWYATKDSIFPRTENLNDLMQDVRKVYSLYQSQHLLSWEAFEGPHRFPSEARQRAYTWLERTGFQPIPSSTLDGGPGARKDSGTNSSKLKSSSVFFPTELVMQARQNARVHPWAAQIRDPLISAAKPWMNFSDDELWSLMFGATIRRSWMVWSDGHCPACQKPVPMYEWRADALQHPWKMQCPRCNEFFPKNNFLKFYRSGLNEAGIFDPSRGDRSLLYNEEHPDPADPLHRFGVDDGEGYLEAGKRWRFVGAYLIFGQWKQAVVDGIRNLAAAYLATGESTYAHRAGVLLDRVADLYPEFDFGKQGVLYEGPPRSGYISTWHDACVEVNELAWAYDAVFEGLARDDQLVKFLAAKAAKHRLANPKPSFADIQRNIEERIFGDTLEHRQKIESNYPSTDLAIINIKTVLGWPGNREEVMKLLDKIIENATAVDGLTGEKGIAGYSAIAPRIIAELLGRYARADPGFISETMRRYPRLHAMYRFHLDTFCLNAYYPRSGDTGSYAEKDSGYAAMPFTRNPGIGPSAYSFMWELYHATGDKDFVRLLYAANASSSEGLPYDLFAADPERFQTNVARVIREHGAELQLTSVNKSEWCLAILRAGEKTNSRAAWLDYDSGENHGHADGMTIGLFAKGLDLLPDFGYPPVQYGGWTSPRALWYGKTAAHNTVAVDGQNLRSGKGTTTLWMSGRQFRVVRASGASLIPGEQFERTLALNDISDRDSYVVDIFRVKGGSEHTRFLHGHFGKLSTKGLSTQKADESGFGSVMRNFRKDPKPAVGWSVDWLVQDRLGYLPRDSEIHLRHTDLTSEVETELAESWVSVGSFGGTAEEWIPTVLVKRRKPEAPLFSTFISVLEPYEKKSNIDDIKRLELHGIDGTLCPDGNVAIEVLFSNGERDILISANTEPLGSSQRPLPALLEKKSGVQFEGDFCILRLDRARKPTRVMFCRGKSLRLGQFVMRTKNDKTNFEIDLSNKKEPIISGPAETLDLLELDGDRFWPKE